MMAARLTLALRSAVARRPSLRVASAPNQSVARFARPARAFSSVTFTFVDAEGEAKQVAAPEGQTLADVAHDNDIELECAVEAWLVWQFVCT